MSGSAGVEAEIVEDEFEWAEAVVGGKTEGGMLLDWDWVVMLVMEGGVSRKEG